MALTGLETLQVLGQDGIGSPAATTFQTTTQAIANLAAAGQGNMVNTAINTVGAGTLTAAGIVGRIITRGGSQSATPFTDTTATAAQIITALGANATVGESFKLVLVNNTNAVETVSAGSGVTVTIISSLPQNSWAEYLVTYSAAATVTMVGIESGSLNAPSIASGKTLGVNNSITLAGTDSTTMTFPSTSATVARTDAANTFTGTQTIGALVATTVNGNTVTAGTGVLTLQGSAQTFTSPAATDTLVGRASTDTLTNKTITAPTITGPIVGTEVHNSTASQTANANTTYASVTGLLQTVVAGTYRFRCVLPSTVASGTGGIKYSFHYVTTALTSLEATGMGYTSAAVAVQHTTSTSDVADLFSQAAVVIMTIIEGTMVVSTGGTIQLQMAQNTSNASNSVTLLGASMAFDRIS